MQRRPRTYVVSAAADFCRSLEKQPQSVLLYELLSNSFKSISTTVGSHGPVLFQYTRGTVVCHDLVGVAAAVTRFSSVWAFMFHRQLCPAHGQVEGDDFAGVADFRFTRVSGRETGADDGIPIVVIATIGIGLFVCDPTALGAFTRYR